MKEPTDLDIRIAALSQEYEATIQAITRRAATLASELASVQTKLKTAEASKDELQKKPDADADEAAHRIE